MAKLYVHSRAGGGGTEKLYLYFLNSGYLREGLSTDKTKHEDSTSKLRQNRRSRRWADQAAHATAPVPGPEPAKAASILE